ncbi:MAG: RNA polymerase sigma factor [Erysipelotrichaceae bacterium]|nr:RNA polymerase sigma factor [Erysipelotrichaceae bacterium]
MKTEELIIRIQNDDKESFEQLLKENRGLIYSVINSRDLQMGAFKIDEDELFQEGSIALYEAAMTYKGGKGTKFSTWAYKIIYCRIIDRIRELRCRSGLDFYSLDTFNNLEYSNAFAVEDNCVAYVKEKEFEKDVGSFLMSLSKEDRRIFELRKEGLSYRQIGIILKIDEKKVDNRLLAIRKKLKNYLKEEKEEDYLPT